MFFKPQKNSEYWPDISIIISDFSPKGAKPYDIKTASKTTPTNESDIKHSLNKLGNTPFKFEELKIEKDNNIFIRDYSLNELRRKMVDELLEIMNEVKSFVKEKYSINLIEEKEEKGFNVLVTNIEDYNAIKNKEIKNIYMNKELYNEINDSRKVLKLERVVSNYNIDENILIGELGGVYNKNGYTDYSLNVVNSYSVAFLHSLGIKRVTLSYELTDYQIEEIIDNYKKRYHQNPNLELIVSSTPEVMISKFNLIKYFNLNNKNNYLKDSYNNLFKVENIDNKMVIKFYKKIVLNNYQKYFDMGINTLRIHIEDKEDYNF